MGNNRTVINKIRPKLFRSKIEPLYLNIGSVYPIPNPKIKEIINNFNDRNREIISVLLKEYYRLSLDTLDK